MHIFWSFATICIYFANNNELTAQAQNVVPSVVQIGGDNERRPAFQTDLKGNHTITIEDDNFMVDGQPLRIISGSLHYFRVPAAYWRDRLRKLKAAGLNSVATYVEWSFHEPEVRQYNFEGDRDVAQFIRIAAEEGLHVLLRPGPYICAERDLGGFPYWLLSNYPKIKLRTPDKDFINETEIWMNKLFEQLTSLLFGNGGPIILVQVENEYGSYGKDKNYMGKIRDILLEHVGTKALLYTTDGSLGTCSSGMFVDGSIAGALTTIDFGAGFAMNNALAQLRCFMPHGPLMNSEYYPGWLTHWGESLQRVDTDSVVRTLRGMLDRNMSVNFYMFFGGTNFEFTAGANYVGSYVPDITSYDYDAPMSEAGDPTPKYFAIRDALKKYNPEIENISPPTPSEKGDYGPVTMSGNMRLLSPDGRVKLGKKYTNVIGEKLPTFEALRQRSGLVLYETSVKGLPKNGLLYISKTCDRIYIYVDGQYQGYLSRSDKMYSSPIVIGDNSTLSLLVENQGRINYGSYLHDFKGILSPVIYDGKSLNNTWHITGFPLEDVDVVSAPGSVDINLGPILYEGTFTLPAGKEPLETFLDTSGWGKGYAWVNGYNLGRYWPTKGPQVTLYVPGVWLHAPPATNRLQLLELEQTPANLTMQFINYPILQK